MIETKKAIITIEGKQFEMEDCEIWAPDHDSPYWLIKGKRSGKQCSIVMSGTVLIEYVSE